MPSGVSGFRAWFNPDGLPTGFIKRPCGWSGLLHYAFRDHVRATKGKCATWYQIARKIWGYTTEQARMFERRLEYGWGFGHMLPEVPRRNHAHEVIGMAVE